MELEFLKKGLELFRIPTTARFAVMDAHRGIYPIAMMCATLAVADSKFYAWLRSGRETQREKEDRRLMVEIKALHTEWGGTFGYRRMQDCLRELQGLEVGARRIRRLMQDTELQGIPAKKHRKRVTAADDLEAPDLLRRNFKATRTNELWVTDISLIKTRKGNLHLCIVKDLYDGLVIAWRLDARQIATLVTATVYAPVEARLDCERPVVHSDHGSQYTSKAYQACLERHNLKMSMGRVRTCADNASAEAVFRAAQARDGESVPFRDARRSYETHQPVFSESVHPIEVQVGYEI